MPRQIVYTPKAAKPPATYSQAVRAAGLVFVSGTAPHDPANGQIKGPTIQEQTRQCLTNIAAILEEAGSSLDKIVNATIVLADEEDFTGMNEEWLRWFLPIPLLGRVRSCPQRFPGSRFLSRPSLRRNFFALSKSGSECRGPRSELSVEH
jgi:2-iminobutanoate/2-iminopropanoate deaminase